MRFAHSNGGSSSSVDTRSTGSASEDFRRTLREWSKGFSLVGLLLFLPSGLGADVDDSPSNFQESLTIGGPRC